MTPSQALILGEELDEDLLDELLEDEEDFVGDEGQSPTEESAGSQDIDLRKLEAEIKELEDYIRWARSIGVDTKTKSLLQALEVGFAEMSRMGAAPKAVIFTESRRTQAYLRTFLEANGYAGQIVTFNGSNSEPESTELYKRWLRKSEGTGLISRSRAIDVRSAIIEEFRETASLMIATEAAAEGVNLQFCSLVINFDLPWNPQRIEQRIGRCHRYGQEHDVVVINFLNERNHADRRVYELLDDKFSLFSGIFGASDEVLGTIESGVDFERKVLDIYQKCRTSDEIQQAFSELQTELDEKIQSRIQDTRKILLEHFDEDVHARLKVNLHGTKERLDAMSTMFWLLTQFILDSQARFFDDTVSFKLEESPIHDCKPGRYKLISKNAKVDGTSSQYLYRLSHPLGEYVLNQARMLDTPTAEVIFDISNHPTRISVVEKLKGKSGFLTLQRLVIESFEHEDYLLFSGLLDDGKALDQETCTKLFSCDGKVAEAIEIPGEVCGKLSANADRHVLATINRSLEKNNRHFNEAREQLDKWAEDMELAAQKELDDTKAQIRALTREARQAETVEQAHDIQEKVRKLERKKRQLRQKIFDVEDEIAAKRDQLVEALEKRMQQKTETTTLFAARWRVV